MLSNSNSQNGSAAPVWPSMDSIMPPNFENGAGAGGKDVPNGQLAPQLQGSSPHQIQDTRLPGAPPLPVAGPTPRPSSGLGMLRVAAPPGARPGERAAAIAARAAAAPLAVNPELSGESWNAPNALVPGGAQAPQTASSGFNLRSDLDANLISMPNLNKVRLPNPTSIVNAASVPVKTAAGPAKATRSVEPEVANPLTSEPDVSPARMESAPVLVAEAAEDSFPNSTQLALQVIFGYEGDLTRQEVLDLAKGLEGVKEVKLVGGPEAAAMKILKESAEKFGYGGENGLILRSSGYPVEYVGDSKVCLCVVLEQPVLPKGTREKLTLIAREAARIG